MVNILLIFKISKSLDFDSSKTESFGSARNSFEFRHAQKSLISDIRNMEITWIN